MKRRDYHSYEYLIVKNPNVSINFQKLHIKWGTYRPFYKPSSPFSSGTNNESNKQKSDTDNESNKQKSDTDNESNKEKL